MGTQSQVGEVLNVSGIYLAYLTKISLLQTLLFHYIFPKAPTFQGGNDVRLISDF